MQSALSAFNCPRADFSLNKTMNQVKVKRFGKDELIRDYALYRWLILDKKNSYWLGLGLNLASFVLPTIVCGFPLLLYLTLPFSNVMSVLLSSVAWLLSAGVLAHSSDGGFELFDFTKRYAVVALANDPRPPIIYFRAFFEDTLYDEDFSELIVTSAAKKFGPVVSIGQPGEVLPSKGASRAYVAPEDNWQKAVTELLVKAQFVIISPDLTPGILWEIMEAIKLCGPEKIIFTLVNFEEKGKNIYSRFRTALAKQSSKLDGPIFLPEDIGSSRFLYFDSNWHPHLVGGNSELFDGRPHLYDKHSELIDAADATQALERLLEVRYALERVFIEKGGKRRPLTIWENAFKWLRACYQCVLFVIFLGSPFVVIFGESIWAAISWRHR